MDRWLDFLAEYEFQVRYWKCYSNGAADFLFRVTHADQGVDGYEEGDLINSIIDGEVLKKMLENFERDLQDIARHLAGVPLENKMKSEEASIRRKAVKFVLWQGRLFRRKQSRLLVVVSQFVGTKVLQPLHDDLDHWDSAATKSHLAERFWWHAHLNDATRYTRTCDASQRMKTPRHYKTSKSAPQCGVF